MIWKKVLAIACFVLCMFFVNPVVASAVDYSAKVTYACGPHSSIFSPGETVEISYTLDPLVADWDSNPQSGLYFQAVTSLSVTFPDIGISVVSGPSGNAFTCNNCVDPFSGEISDQVFFFGGPVVSSSELEGEPIIGVEVDFLSRFFVPPAEAVMLNNDALPLHSLPMTDSLLFLATGSDWTQVNFASVPEPPLIILFGSGLLSLAWTRIRKKMES